MLCRHLRVNCVDMVLLPKPFVLDPSTFRLIMFGDWRGRLDRGRSGRRYGVRSAEYADGWEVGIGNWWRRLWIILVLRRIWWVGEQRDRATTHWNNSLISLLFYVLSWSPGHWVVELGALSVECTTSHGHHTASWHHMLGCRLKTDHQPINCFPHSIVHLSLESM